MRMKWMEVEAGAVKALMAAETYVSKSGIEPQLLHLIKFRVSQINGCAFCLDMHSKDLRAGGETEQRLYVLDAWREAPFYTSRERAALAFAEAMTTLVHGTVPDDVYEAARAEFSESELVQLAVAVTTINAWNRLNIAFGAEAGGYQPGMYGKAVG